MKKWFIISAALLFIVALLALAYPSYLDMLSTTGQVVNIQGNKKTAAGVAFTIAILIIGLIGYLTSRYKPEKLSV